MPEDTEDQALRAQGPAMWSGTISFGLVSIPVYLATAVREGRLSLRMLDQDGTPLARRYYNATTDKEVSNDDLIRGYEIEPGKFVPVTDEELESLMPEKSRDIDLRLFVPDQAIDPMYFERAYFLLPNKESTKAYRLLAETMEKTGKVGIATFVLREKEHLVAIISENGILRAETMRFHDEVRSPSDVELPPIKKADSEAISRIEKAMESITEKSLNVKELKSDYNDKLLALVEKKRKKGEGVVERKSTEVSEGGGGGSVINLMEALKKSFEANKSSITTRKRSTSPADEEPSDKPGKKGHPGKRGPAAKPLVRKKK